MSALGKVARSGVTRRIGEQTFEFQPLTLRDYGALQRQAVYHYRQNQLEAYRRNLDMFPEDQRLPILKSVMEQAAKLDESDLPPKTFHIDKDGGVTMNAEEAVSKQVVEYWHWWMAYTYEGRLHAIWLSLRHAQPEMSVDQVEQLVLNRPESLEELANIVGDLSNPTLGGEPKEPSGNGEAPAMTGASRSTGRRLSTSSA